MQFDSWVSETAGSVGLQVVEIMMNQLSNKQIVFAGCAKDASFAPSDLDWKERTLSSIA